MLGSSRGGAGGVGDVDGGGVGEGSRATEPPGAGVAPPWPSGGGSSTITTTSPTTIATTTTTPAVMVRVLTLTFVTVPRAHKRSPRAAPLPVGPPAQSDAVHEDPDPAMTDLVG